jgi:hypothetical protein
MDRANELRRAPRFPIPAGSLAAAASLTDEANIERLWQQRAALNRNEQMADDFGDVLELTELAVLDSRATGPRVAEMRLWLALTNHPSVTGKADEAARDENLNGLRLVFDTLDWDVKMIVSAIAALRGETVHG